MYLIKKTNVFKNQCFIINDKMGLNPLYLNKINPRRISTIFKWILKALKKKKQTYRLSNKKTMSTKKKISTSIIII